MWSGWGWEVGGGSEGRVDIRISQCTEKGGRSEGRGKQSKENFLRGILARNERRKGGREGENEGGWELVGGWVGGWGGTDGRRTEEWRSEGMEGAGAEGEGGESTAVP